MKVIFRSSTSVTTAEAMTSVPRPEGLIWVTFISAPTVVAPSGNAPATANMAAFSISATMAGVAKTGMSPEPMAAAVFCGVTVVRLTAVSPFSNMMISVLGTN